MISTTKKASLRQTIWEETGKCGICHSKCRYDLLSLVTFVEAFESFESV